MVTKAKVTLVFYCPSHQIRFPVEGTAAVQCEQGHHTLGDGFPNESWWEYCCDCSTFWASEPANGNLRRSDCLVCERTIVKRYLCPGCKVVCLESNALVRRKTHSIDVSAGIKPNCPACSTIANTQLQEHNCDEAHVILLTPRAACPFCEEKLQTHTIKPSQTQESISIVCPFCGTQQKLGNRFCKRCGKPQPASEDAAASSAAHFREEAARLLRVEEERRLAERRRAEEKRREEEKRLLYEKRRLEEERLLQEERSLSEERERQAVKLQRRAEEEARRAAEAESRRLAEAGAKLRQEKEGVAERLRVERAQQEAEQQRLTAQIQRPAEAEEAQGAAEAEGQQIEEREVAVSSSPDPEKQGLPLVAIETNAVHDVKPALLSNGLEDSSAAEVSQPESDDSGFQFEVASDPSVRNEAADLNDTGYAKVQEYVPTWVQPSAFDSPQRRILPWKWIVGLLSVVVIGIVATVVFVSRPFTRAESGNKDAVTSSPITPTTPAGMVRIPGGEFLMGSDKPGTENQEKPVHKVTVAPFYIDVTEVTCEQYQKFVQATGHRAPPYWSNGLCPSGDARKAVTGVDWYDASAYAKWANKRLPTEEEWEFAARGRTAGIYPWGNEWQTGAANAEKASKGIVDVGTFKGKSPFETHDMIGNAWEWTSSKLTPYPGGKLDQESGDDLRVIRGGSWESERDSANTTYRFGWPASGDNYKNTGFRCAQDINPSEPNSRQTP